MTWDEFSIYVEAHAKERNHMIDWIAWQTAHIVNPHVKGRVTGKKLLGRSKSLLGASREEVHEAMTGDAK